MRIAGFLRDSQIEVPRMCMRSLCVIAIYGINQQSTRSSSYATYTGHWKLIFTLRGARAHYQACSVQINLAYCFLLKEEIIAAGRV